MRQVLNILKQVCLCRADHFPREGPGVNSRMCPPYPQRDRKRRLNGAVCRNHRIKGWSRVGARTGTLKEPTKCLWRLEPDRRSNFFSPPAHRCAVTYMTEISLIVTLNNQFTSHAPHLRADHYLQVFIPINGTQVHDWGPLVNILW